MAIEKLPAFYNMKYTEENGKMTVESYLFNDQTFQTLNAVVNLLNLITSTVVNQSGVTVNSVIVPTFSSDPSGLPIGSIWYNSTANALKFQSNSGIQQITSV